MTGDLVDLYNWNGEFIGFKDGDYFWGRDGRYLGFYNDSEVFDKAGRYLGERRDGRLITRTDKKNKNCRVAFIAPTVTRIINPYIAKPIDESSWELPPGYESFPNPDTL